jgi:hypothetical protein
MGDRAQREGDGKTGEAAVRTAERLMRNEGSVY